MKIQSWEEQKLEMNEDDSKETKHIFYTCLSLFSLVVVWQIFVYSPFIS